MKAKQETRCRAVKDILLDWDNPPVNGKLPHVLDSAQKKLQDSATAFAKAVVRLITEPEATDKPEVKAGDTRVPLRLVHLGGNPSVVICSQGIARSPSKASFLPFDS